MGIGHSIESGIAEVVIDVPPVNALRVAHWFELAEAVAELGRQASTRVVVVRAEGRGFCAGVDIKELQESPGHQALVEVNRGCYAAFAALRDCEAPVVVAVQGFCLGGGVGIAGSSDVLVASEDATFGLPEVDRGALGAATHLSRLVPAQRARAMLLLAETATAAELAAFGSVYRVVPRDRLVEAAREVAAAIAAKSPTVMRRAKESLNGIEAVDPKRSYRFEQGFTFELNLTGVSDEARAAFVEGREAKYSR
jgi:enoyl-CoA hydratase